MKITLWQQFSSNHSGGFTIVGTFENVESAKEAANQLRTMLKDIFLQSIGYSDKEPVQAELDYGKQFGIDWEEHIDWIYEEYEQVFQFDNHVVVSDVHGSTWQRGKPIEQIMIKLTPQVAIRQSDYYVIVVELKCIAPTLQKATELFNILDSYFVEVRAERGHLAEPPWRVTTQQVHSYGDSGIHDDAYYGYVYRTNMGLKFSNLTFGTIGVGLPSMLEYLKQEGCTNIEYKIKRGDANEVFEENL